LAWVSLKFWHGSFHPLSGFCRISLRAARGLVGWSQEELAQAAKVGLSTVRDFEASRRRPIRVYPGIHLRLCPQYDWHRLGVDRPHLGIRLGMKPKSSPPILGFESLFR
jgi:DNA-binding XRE family transcriptional regulator